MSDKLPIIDQLHNAADDRGRADVLLRCPDATLLKYGDVFLRACREFPAGELFIQERILCMRAVRSAAGGLPGGLALELETLRAELSAYAAGAEIARQQAAPDEWIWPLDATQPPYRPPSLDI